jgi:hypothetical protein
MNDALVTPGDVGARAAKACNVVHTPHVYPRNPGTLPAHSTH